MIGAPECDETPHLGTLVGCFTIVLAGVASIRLERRSCAYTDRQRTSDRLDRAHASMKPMSERTTGWVFVATQAVLLVALILLPTEDDFSVPDWLRTVADVLFWLGIALMLAAAAFLGRSLTATPVPRDRAELRTSGPYRWARHPIYSGVILVVVALSVRSGSIITVATGVVTLVFFVVKSRWEERRLAARFPGYADYAARTGRFFPGW